MTDYSCILRKMAAEGQGYFSEEDRLRLLKAADRIAELEELLTEPLYASEHYVLNKTYKKHANDKVGRITVSFGWMRRLHAALNGEKG